MKLTSILSSVLLTIWTAAVAAPLEPQKLAIAAAEPVEVLDGATFTSEDPLEPDDAACIKPYSCTCGVPVFDFNDPGCLPGVNLHVDHCGSQECGEGLVMRRRICPCEGQGCSATWGNNVCAMP